MKLIRSLAVCLLLAGCGVRPDGPTPGGDAPTGVSPGVTLYFVDNQERLQPDERKTGRLGSIAEALALLLTGFPRDAPDRHTEIARSPVTQVTVTTEPELVQLVLPLDRKEVTQLGIDQITCTALGVHLQGGGPRTAKVLLRFTHGGSPEPRTCPLIK
ncbi:hypothetical protein [Amycolatopsis benzoatilytica]|uniref:hypothetical protein n=1 Tax=Amycolatopsis benzoatilytica TaxID=346045 RepID=UPI00037ED3CF|nr:hypothetical protein [Amycolatopsis benzoatilytica]